MTHSRYAITTQWMKEGCVNTCIIQPGWSVSGFFFKKINSINIDHLCDNWQVLRRLGQSYGEARRTTWKQGLLPAVMEGLRPLPTAMRVSPEADLPASQPFSDWSPGQYLDWNLVRNPKQEPFSQAPLKCLTHRTREKINIYSFKPVSLGIICCTATDNW